MRKLVRERKREWKRKRRKEEIKTKENKTVYLSERESAKVTQCTSLSKNTKKMSKDRHESIDDDGVVPSYVVYEFCV